MSQPIEATVDTISRIIESAKKEVIISSGKFSKMCWGNEKIITAVEKAKDRNVKFHVLVGPELDSSSGAIISLLKDDIHVAATKPSFHFTVADSKNLRFETRDIDGDGSSQNLEHWDDFASGGYLRNKFFASIPKTISYSSWLQKQEVNSR